MENGWMENGEIVWVDDAFPDDISKLITTPYHQVLETAHCKHFHISERKKLKNALSTILGVI